MTVEKTVYRIRGNIFVKMCVYALTAGLAFAAICYGVLTLQGYNYMGGIDGSISSESASSEANRIATLYNNRVDKYISDRYDAWSNVTSYEEYEKLDVNGDNILNTDDFYSSAGLSTERFESWLSEKYADDYDELKDSDYACVSLSVSYENGDSDSKNGIDSFVMGSSSILYKSDGVVKAEEDDTVYKNAVRYVAYDTEAAMKSAEGIIAQMSDYSVMTDDFAQAYEGDYTVSEDDIDEYKDTLLYKSMWPSNIEVLYSGGAASGIGKTVTNGYILKLGYDASDGADCAREYVEAVVDIDKYVKMIASDGDTGANMSKWENNYKSIVTCFVAVFFALTICIVITMVNAGVKVGKKKCELWKLEKLPVELDILLIAVFVTAAVFMAELVSHADIETYITNYTYLTDSYVVRLLAGVAAVWLVTALVFFNNLIAKLRAGAFLRQSIVCRGLCLLRNGIGRLWSKASRCAGYVKSHLSLTWQAVVAYILLTIVEIIALAIAISVSGAWNGGVIVCIYVIGKLLAMAALAFFVIQCQELYRCAEAMSEGDIDRKVDTSHMIWAFKAHGSHLNRMGEAVSKAVDARMRSEHLKTELITNVSHDIKTPLTSIINYVDLLEKDNLDAATQAEYIEVLSRQSARLKKLIEDLVEASKASTGNIQMNFSSLDANMLLEQAVAEYEDKLAAQGLRMVFKKSEGAALITADGQQLWRVFDNLLSNIRKYAMPKTRVYASVRTDNRHVLIEFKNISREELDISSEELMERFVRGDSSRNTEGSGLGLSIAKSLCTLMGAEFSLDIDGDLFKATICFEISANAPR